MTDMTDRFNEIENELNRGSLTDWDDNPEPTVGSPSGDTIFEQVRETSYVWDLSNSDAILKFTGETMEVKQ